MSPPISLVKLAHQLIKTVVKPGDVVIDATAGNGYDTCFLAQWVGVNGEVYGFDIQQAAITASLHRLQNLPCATNVTLFHASHTTMANCIPKNHHGKISAIMFNLGYLPGGDKMLITQPATTLAALTMASNLLKVNGLISILAYPGHLGGVDETGQIAAWCQQLNPQAYCYDLYIGNPDNAASPVLYIVRKLSSTCST
jgi:tRNA1(Val) A37 N6-methylase TrmN6